MTAPYIDAARLKAFFSAFTWNRMCPPYPGFGCDKMQRAWRNRSPVTSSPWWSFAIALGSSDYAGPIYAACGEFAIGGIFLAADLTPEQLEKLAKIIVAYIRKPPEKALSRGQYEEHKRRIPTKAQVAHKLYEALILLRTHRAAEEQTAVRAAVKEAESDYRKVFRPYDNGKGKKAAEPT